MSKVLPFLFVLPTAMSGQISFIKNHFTYIYAQEVSKPYELSNGNFVCSVQHGQNNVWFNVIYLFDQCGEFITSLHVSTPEEYMFFSDFIQVDTNKMVASAFVVDSVFHSVFLTLDINTLEVLDERRYFEGGGLRVDKSFLEQDRIYQLGARGMNVVSSSMNLELTRNLHLYKVFDQKEYPELRYIMSKVYSKNRVYSLEDYRDPDFSYYYSVLRCLDGRLRDVYTIDPTTTSVFVKIDEQFVCSGNDTLLLGASEYIDGIEVQKYFRKYYRDSLLYEKPVQGFENFFDFTVCDYDDEQIKCVNYDGKIGVFDKNGEQIYLSEHLISLMHEGDMSLAVTSGEGGWLSVADNYVQVNGNWHDVLTLIKVTKDFQILDKPDPRCIVSTSEPEEITSAIIFPNPAAGHIHVSSPSIVKSYSILDASSKLLLSDHPLSREFDVSMDLVPGMYVILLESDSGTGSYKLLVIK